MSDPIIIVENLGKKYRIRHQAQRQRYTALRDVLADRAKSAFRGLWRLGRAQREEGRGNDGQARAASSPLSTVSTSEDFWALRNVSFEVKQGEVIGIIGRNGAILGRTRAEIKKKFDESVAFAEIEKFLDTPVKRYSSGMYVRLAFAVAAHLEPEILIVDEVLAVGDAEFQKKCLGKMQEVASREGRTVLFVSHNLAAVESLCSSGLLLEMGSLR